ncbi:hypothetical protein [Methylobacterium sp. GC_Met_2]|uniref:hypothetical protein n=1 Tax=Methylobacterium sp. GC_Met_2 TaxID=2937376 RepID=UPI00226B0D15|nr:hypothetical protein [Methylobacterium sp. GC_Met_2]
MKMLLAVAMVFGSTVSALAGEAYGDYRDYFEAKPATIKRAPRSASETTDPVDRRGQTEGDRVEMYRYGDDGIGRTPDVRPRSWDGGYVPVRPRSASTDGFWSPIDQSHEGSEVHRPRYR